MRVIDRIRGSRRLGFALVLLGCAFFMVRGLYDEPVTQQSSDFLPVYSGARCLVKGVDPYNPQALLDVNRSSGVNMDWAVYTLRSEVPVYPPTSLFLLTPLGAMGWWPARLIWLLMAGLSYALATVLVWDLCAEYAPVAAGALLGAFTATSLLLMMTANPTMFAVALCAIAVWCVMRQRLVWLGVVCLALSLLLKPQVGGFVWLYFLLASPAHRRFAWKTLAATVAGGIPAILWISWMPASRHWLWELYTTVSTSVAPGGTAAPGMGDVSSYNMVNLQSLFSVFWENPHFYNWMTYAIVGSMTAIWIWVSAKRTATEGMAYMGVATGALLSLLPVYHRLYDMRLLLLMFPAAIMLWSKRGRRGWLAAGCVVVVTLVSLDRLVDFLEHHQHMFYAGPLWLKLAGRPYPFVALLVALIFLWIYE